MRENLILSTTEKRMIVQTYKIRSFLNTFGVRRARRNNWISFNTRPHVNNLIALLNHLGKNLVGIDPDFFYSISMAIAYGAILVELQSEKTLTVGEIRNMGEVADKLIEHSREVYDTIIIGMNKLYGDEEHGTK